MSYQVLARKWRPKDFSQTVGQEHVLRALINALDNQRLHHAYLFTGTRGVGKTTIARILAKSLNCDQGISSKPCGTCSACTEIDQGRFIDLIEVDAASKTKVEDTRDLLENVPYAPTRGRFKVYLVDEVHMLSTHSFNALLKTLEEPPPHVKFLLATTDPQKLPITVLSRCLQFNLKRISVEKITHYIEMVLTNEKIEYEKSAVPPIALAADGSMRDALSILDQAISFGNGKISTTDIQDMLGSINMEYIFEILNALIERDGPKLMHLCRSIEERAFDFFDVLRELISALHKIAIYQFVPEVEDFDQNSYESIAKIASALNPEDVQLYYQIAIVGRGDLSFAANPRSGFEMILLRMLAFYPIQSESKQQENTRLKQTNSIPNTITKNTQRSPVADYPQDSQKPEVSHQKSQSSDVKLESVNWKDLIDCLNLTGITKQLAIHCVIREATDKSFHLLIDNRHQHLNSENQRSLLESALSQYFASSIRLQITAEEITAITPAQEEEKRQKLRQEDAEQTINNDTNVQNLLRTFDGEIIPGSIKPTDQE